MLIKRRDIDIYIASAKGASEISSIFEVIKDIWNMFESY